MKGARMFENVRVAEVLTKAGGVTGVRMEDGQIIECEKVINCAGMWARQLAAKNGAQPSRANAFVRATIAQALRCPIRPLSTTIWCAFSRVCAAIRAERAACATLHRQVTDAIPGVDPNWPVVEDPSCYTYIRPEGDGLMVGLFEPEVRDGARGLARGGSARWSLS